MRYILEVKTDKGDKALTKFMQEQGAKSIDYVDSYDVKERIAASVEKVGLALREFKASGVNWDVFYYYLRGRGHSQVEINGLLADVQGFFEKLGLLEPEKP